MGKIILFLTCCLLLAPSSQLFSQNAVDSLKTGKLQIDEARLVQEQQQQQIDSLVKIQLRQELKLATGNSSRTVELEQKLNEIAKSDSLRRIEQLKKINILKKTAPGFPVFLHQDTLFHIFTRSGSFSAADRAASASKKILELYNDPFFSPDSLTISKSEDNYDLIYKKNLIILTVSNLDGLWFNQLNSSLVKDYQEKIKTAIIQERKSNSLLNWAKRIGLVMLIIGMLALIISGINFLFRNMTAWMTNRKSSFLAGIKIRNVRIFTAEHLERIFQRSINILRIVVIILVIYLSLPLLFSVFPETEMWTGTLLNWILTPLRIAFSAIAHYIPNLFTILIIYFIFRSILRAFKYFFYEVKRKNITLRGFHEDWAIPTFNILRFVLYAFMLILIFPYLPGSGSPAFQGVSVFLGILLSLGSSSAITNIVAGLVITYMRPFKVGDRVKIGEVTGDVIEKSMLVTRIKTIKNEDITVPNSMVLSSSTVNYSNHAKQDCDGLIVHYTLTIGYDVSWKEVYALLIQAALKTRYISEQPSPFVLQTSLDDFYISYQINAYTREPNKQAEIYSLLLENIQDTFNAAGIEILSPHYRAIRNGEDLAVPPNFVPKQKDKTHPNQNDEEKN